MESTAMLHGQGELGVVLIVENEPPLSGIRNGTCSVTIKKQTKKAAIFESLALRKTGFLNCLWGSCSFGTGRRAGKIAIDFTEPLKALDCGHDEG